METPAVMTTLAGLLDNVGTFLTSLVGWFGTLLTFWTSHPVLYVFILLSIGGTALVWLRRWIPGRS